MSDLKSLEKSSQGCILSRSNFIIYLDEATLVCDLSDVDITNWSPVVVDWLPHTGNTFI